MARTCSQVRAARAARAARLFSLARQIKFLICGVAVAVPVIRVLETFRSDNDHDYDYESRTWEAGTRL